MFQKYLIEPPLLDITKDNQVPYLRYESSKFHFHLQFLNFLFGMYRERFAWFFVESICCLPHLRPLFLCFSLCSKMAIVHLPTSAIHSIDMHLLTHSFIQQIFSYLMPAVHQSHSKHRSTKAKSLVLSIDLVSREICSMFGGNQHPEKFKSGEGDRDWQGSQEWPL